MTDCDSTAASTRATSTQAWLDTKKKGPCPDCGELYFNAGAHAERCYGPVFRCVDPERAWIDEQREQHG